MPDPRIAITGEVVPLSTNIFLVALLAISVLGKNQLVSIATAFLLLLRLLNINWVFPYVEEAGLRIGLTILVFSILAPLASSDLPIQSLTRLLASPVGLAALIGGVAGAWLGAQGLNILQSRPESILGLVLGTIVGATFLNGIPIGPLVAAGLATLLLRIFGYRF